MEIINHSNNISTKQIMECINLLPKKYRKLKDTIIVYDTEDKCSIGNYLIENARYYNRLNFANYNIGATEYPNKLIPNSKGEIHIYEFIINKLKDKELRKIYFAGSLYHEIRHAYQRVFNPLGLFRNQEWRENDACDFTLNFCYNNKNRLNKIFRIRKQNWIFDNRQSLSALELTY